MFARLRTNRVGKREIARRKILDQRQLPDAHHKIGGDRRQDAGRIRVAETRHRNAMRRVQMHDRLRVGTFLVHREMKERFLRGRVTGEEPSVGRDLGDTPRIEPAEAGIGR